MVAGFFSVFFDPGNQNIALRALLHISEFVREQCRSLFLALLIDLGQFLLRPGFFALRAAHASFCQIANYLAAPYAVPEIRVLLLGSCRIEFLTFFKLL